jgi:hypothetical protein
LILLRQSGKVGPGTSVLTFVNLTKKDRLVFFSFFPIQHAPLHRTAPAAKVMGSTCALRGQSGRSKMSPSLTANQAPNRTAFGAIRHLIHIRRSHSYSQQ